ncbi:hypothetical protein B0H19DRAFT_1055367 [Mycena capillaripes]|nr:hypothetical protein B0H19DRAFT_1055367 [Mycena capillaripes]
MTAVGHPKNFEPPPRPPGKSWDAGLADCKQPPSPIVMKPFLPVVILTSSVINGIKSAVFIVRHRQPLATKLISSGLQWRSAPRYSTAIQHNLPELEASLKLKNSISGMTRAGGDHGKPIRASWKPSPPAASGSRRQGDRLYYSAGDASDHAALTASRKLFWDRSPHDKSLEPKACASKSQGQTIERLFFHEGLVR